ncbi:MAG: hypothetical protein A2X55_07840 [Nitrospirae bacterium GWB2_47_37]|nr:MAG: hypothetical protein A2X55_07840 [Nitrospirae bacterium GWB2_47_37]
MKCPNPKCKKKGDLQTKRTIAAGRTVQRERHCPVCGERCMTIEMFSEDFNQNRRDNEYKLNELRGKLSETTDKLESLTFHFQQIFKICGAGKK